MTRPGTFSGHVLPREQDLLPARNARRIGRQRGCARPRARPLALARPSAHPGHPWWLPAHDLTASRASAVTIGSVSERWRAHLAGGVTGAPVVSSDSVWGASFGGDVAAFDLATGTESWRRSLGTAIYGADKRELGFFGGIAVHGDRAVVASTTTSGRRS